MYCIFLMGVFGAIFFQSGEAVLSVTTNPKSILVPASETVLIDCSAKSSDGGKIFVRWIKGTNEYPRDNSDEVQSLPNNTLVIKDLRRRNTGTYQCEVETEFGDSLYAETKVELAYLEKIKGDFPDRKEFAGQEIEISCPEAIGYPNPVPSWLVGLDPPVPLNVSGKPRYTVLGWSLRISNLQAIDANNYTCVATNLARSRSRTMSLEIVIPGSNVVSPPQLNLVEGQTAIFECTSLAKPPLPVYWMKVYKKCPECSEENQDLPADRYVAYSNGTLVISDAKSGDRGLYNCIASLGQAFYDKKVELKVDALLKVDKVLHLDVQKLAVRESTHRIYCEFKGDGDYSVTWSKNGNPLPDRMVQQLNEVHIKNLTFDDAGNYTCLAVGVHNRVSAAVQLIVYDAPQFTVVPENITVIAGTPVWIHCAGQGTPKPVVNWFQKNFYGRDLNRTRFVHLPNNTLYIPSPQLEDSSEYFCLLTVLYSQTSSYFTLNVKRTESEGSAKQPMGRTVSIAVGCAGVYILLVIGLMIYCRTRRNKILKKQALAHGVQDGEAVKDPLMANEDLPLDTIKSYDKWQVPRSALEEIADLGFGKMGRVFVARANGITGAGVQALVAVKELDSKEQEHKAEFDLEVEMFAQLQHNNVARLLGICTQDEPFYLITDYSEEGDLKQYLNEINSGSGSVKAKDMTPSIRASLCRQIASGMEYLIQLRYIHRDLAARNCIAFSNDRVKVSFLSLCEDTYSRDYYLLNGIPVPLRWLSPEAITQESYSEKSDVWSFGVVMWEIFSLGRNPYVDHSDDQILEGVCKDLRLSKPSDCPTSVFTLMQQCWNADSSKRPTFEELALKLSEMCAKDNGAVVSNGATVST